MMAPENPGHERLFPNRIIDGGGKPRSESDCIQVIKLIVFLDYIVD
ncbi:MAG: hypothetical protein BJ554DRAFT_7935 [Olpidium bornovanus]|uniref:Uncharacterized protein n=1 Tax=Olpidium bornovanus TaxID=278681 RepID=A0A8H7ZUW2_9FUNG|nr:MAG: hypothetical protein BJ554DRAFT_7935 [Olpidium bornovanus]